MHRLKAFVRDNLSKEVYREIFSDVSGKHKNYCSYVGIAKINGKRRILKEKNVQKRISTDT